LTRFARSTPVAQFFGRFCCCFERRITVLNTVFSLAVVNTAFETQC